MLSLRFATLAKQKKPDPSNDEPGTYFRRDYCLPVSSFRSQIQREKFKAHQLQSIKFATWRIACVEMNAGTTSIMLAAPAIDTSK
ncbi:MAG: hypothetical protein IPK16_04475 [Anaerolineales bacterium]|nr:hypothetical protein [Anaerolineales bacterium]